MGYSIKQVSDITGMSSRTLRLYDEMGLLVPERNDNGYRSYSPGDLDRLQHIILYRSMGMKLGGIARLLDDERFDTLEAMRGHLETLLERKAELIDAISTVEKTIATMEGGSPMGDAEKFEGLKRSFIETNEQKYGREARDRWGDEPINDATERIAKMSEQEWTRIENLEVHIIELLKKMTTGSQLPQNAKEGLARMHAEWIRGHWGAGAYSPEAHVALTKSYLEDKRFVEYYDSRAGAGATERLVDAVRHYIR